MLVVLLVFSRHQYVHTTYSQQVGDVIGGLEDTWHFFGGVTRRLVIDNFAAGVTKADRYDPIFQRVFNEYAGHRGFVIDPAPVRQPTGKGAVENLVGWVKRAFFRARRFADADQDLMRQLLEWLTVVDEERPSRATRVIPALRMIAERERMKPLAIPANSYALRFAVQAGPTALVDFEGIRYAMPAGACGIPATLYLYTDRVKIVTLGGRFEASHPRFPLTGKTSYMQGQRAEQLAAVAGARKRLYFMRERILELGPVGEAYLTELIHARPHTWKGDVERLFMLLEEIGEAAFLRLLQRALFQRLFGAEYVVPLAHAEVGS